MLFQLLADSFFATAILLCALMYLDYALTVYGQKLYVARGRQFVEMGSYEFNPMWRDIVEKQLYWHPRVLYLFVRMVALAALLWLLKAISSGPGDSALLLRDGALAALISTSLAIISVHVRNVFVFAKLMKPDLISGHIRSTAARGYASARVYAVALALPLAALALLNPTAVTIGFAIGPLLSLQAIWSMQRRHAKLQATEKASAQPPSNSDARPNWTNDQGA